MIGFLSVLLGGGVLIAGRKLFWLFVGAIGFLIGLEAAPRLALKSEPLYIVAGLALGVVFALVAIFLESVAISMAGFLGGGLALMRVAAMLGLDRGLDQFIVFIVGGVLGVILVVWLLNWALIIISSVAGATMAANGLYLRPSSRPLLWLGLVALGILVQGLALHRESARPKSKPQTAK